MRVPTALAAASIATSAILLMAACGSGDSKSPDKIAGVPSGTTTATPTVTATSTSAPAASTAIDPSLALPGDLKMIFEWVTPADHNQAVALTGAANFLQAMAHGVVKQRAEEPGLQTWSVDEARDFGKRYIKQYVDRSWTLTGNDHYYRPKVTMGTNNTTAHIVLCENQAKVYGKEVKTGKVLLTPADDASYVSYDIVMAKFDPQADLWQAHSVKATEKAIACKQ